MKLNYEFLVGGKNCFEKIELFIKENYRKFNWKRQEPKCSEQFSQQL